MSWKQETVMAAKWSAGWCLATISWFIVAASVSIARSAAAAAEWDLTPPTKEPQYQNEPRYALFVFGAKRQPRIWLVLDGTTLYVDRNGNGDLTEPDERLEPKNRPTALLVPPGVLE